MSFVGWVSEDEVTDLMRAAEAVLVPSEWYEGLPLVILRSLSVGTPVITSDLENFPEDVVADQRRRDVPCRRRQRAAGVLLRKVIAIPGTCAACAAGHERRTRSDTRRRSTSHGSKRSTRN